MSQSNNEHSSHSSTGPTVSTLDSEVDTTSKSSGRSRSRKQPNPQKVMTSIEFLASFDETAESRVSETHANTNSTEPEQYVSSAEAISVGVRASTSAVGSISASASKVILPTVSSAPTSASANEKALATTVLPQKSSLSVESNKGARAPENRRIPLATQQSSHSPYPPPLREAPTSNAVGHLSQSYINHGQPTPAFPVPGHAGASTSAYTLFPSQSLLLQPYPQVQPPVHAVPMGNSQRIRVHVEPYGKPKGYKFVESQLRDFVLATTGVEIHDVFRRCGWAKFYVNTVAEAYIVLERLGSQKYIDGHRLLVFKCP